MKRLPDTFLYAAKFSRKGDLIITGGAGKNEVRMFDYKTGKLLTNISGMERSVFSIDYAHMSESFIIGSSDNCLRLMDVV